MKKFLNTLTIFATIVVILFSKQLMASHGKPVFEKNKHATPEMVARYIETNGVEYSDFFISDAHSLANELVKVFNYQNNKYHFIDEAITTQDVPDLLRSSKMVLVKGIWTGNENSSDVRSTGYDPTDKHFSPFNRGPYPNEMVWLFKVNDEVEFYWYSDSCGNPLYDDYHQPKKVVYEPPRTDPEPDPIPDPPKEKDDDDIVYRYPPPPAEDKVVIFNEGDNITIVEGNDYQQPQNYCGTGGGIGFQASAGFYLGTSSGYYGGGSCYQPRNYSCSTGGGGRGGYGGGSSSNATVNNYVDVYVNNQNSNSNTNNVHQTNHQTQTNHQVTATTVNGGGHVVHPPTHTNGGGPVYPPNGPSNPGGTGGGPVYGSNRQARTRDVAQVGTFQTERPLRTSTQQTRERSAQRQMNYGQQTSRITPMRSAPQQRFAQARPMQRQNVARNSGGGSGGSRRSRH